MSRKHFVALASALAGSKPIGVGVPVPKLLKQWKRDVEAIASTVSQFNDNFNRSRFLSACNYEDD